MTAAGGDPSPRAAEIARHLEHLADCLRQDPSILDGVAERLAGMAATIRQPARVHVLVFPWPRPPVVTNGGHGNRYARAALVRQVRNDTWAVARQAGLPKGAHLTVCLHYAPGDRRQRDADNLVLTQKACADALGPSRVARNGRNWVGLDLVPDDSPEHMTKLMPVIHPPPVPGPRCWLTVHEGHHDHDCPCLHAIPEERHG